MDEKNVPLVVDVDGTLLKTDLLAESFRALLLRHPLRALGALRLMKDRAAFKKRIAEAAALDMKTLPVNAEVLALIARAKAQGRKVYLASASDRLHVEALAGHIGLFDGVFASGGGVNLKAEAKAQALCDAFGEQGFDYAGNEAADFPVWRKARAAIVVGGASVAREARHHFPQARILDASCGLKEYAQAMRLHQWPKNLLIFVPALMAHKMTCACLLPALVAFASFSLCASGVYLLNDLIDLDRDRLHPDKRRRMMASGTLPLPRGMKLAGALLLGSLCLALFLPGKFLSVLAAYYALTLAYSLWLKQKMLVDVITLACLYGIRIVSGAALGIELSEWLVAFSFFLFLSLAMIKRCVELINCAADGRSEPAGRGYALSDIPALFGMATGGGYIAVLVLALYIQNPHVMTLYGHPGYLWGACVILTYWINRMLLLTSRGRMHEDPVIFAVTDRGSLLCGALLAALLWISV